MKYGIYLLYSSYHHCDLHQKHVWQFQLLVEYLVHKHYCRCRQRDKGATGAEWFPPETDSLAVTHTRVFPQILTHWLLHKSIHWTIHAVPLRLQLQVLIAKFGLLIITFNMLCFWFIYSLSFSCCYSGTFTTQVKVHTIFSRDEFATTS